MKFSLAVLLLTTLTLLQSALAAEVDFAYSGAAGPDRWSLLSPKNALCNAGKKQSPIDISNEEFLVNRLRPQQPKFGDAENLRFNHTGHTVEVTSADESKPLPVQMKLNGKSFQLAQMHFHTPSEHRVGGQFFDAEGHLVFTSTDKGQQSHAVIAAFFKVGEQHNDFLEPLTAKVPQKKGDEVAVKELSFSQLFGQLDNLKEIYNYEGSFTTPPCTEGLQFLISREIQNIDTAQLLSLREPMGFNARPAQFRPDVVNAKVTKKLRRKSNYKFASVF